MELLLVILFAGYIVVFVGTCVWALVREWLASMPVEQRAPDPPAQPTPDQQRATYLWLQAEKIERAQQDRQRRASWPEHYG